MFTPALLIIDMQRDFIPPDGAAPVDGTDGVVANITRLLTVWRAAGWPIIHVLRFYAPDGSDAELHRRELVRMVGGIVSPGTAGAEIAQGLERPGSAAVDHTRLRGGEPQQLAPQEWAIYKPRWGAFFKTPLERLLVDAGATSLVVCGCNLPNCPRATLFEASERDIPATLVDDATSGSTADRLADLKMIGVAVDATEAVIAEYKKRL